MLLEQYARQVGLELHDTVGQHLAACMMMLERLQEPGFLPLSSTIASRFSLRLREAVAAVRALTDRELLSLEHTDNQDLRSTLERVTKASEAVWQTKCDLQIEDGLRIDDGAALQLARVASEAIANAAKHSDARYVTLVISADGRGFMEMRITHPTNTTAVRLGSDTGLGTAIMRHRVARIGGQFESSQANNHFEIICRVPMHAPNESAAH